MRDRKFKAWLNLDEELGGKKMYVVKGWIEDKYVILEGFGKASINDVKIVENTGVRDCEGTEIYEGDILHRDSHWLMYVEYIEGSYCLVAVDQIQRMNWIPVEMSSDMISGVSKRRVIGNIFSHPEIIETNGEIIYEKVQI